jgi:hypothetical protein
MTQTFRQSLDASVEKVKQMNSDIRKVDFSRWPTYSSGVPKIHELQDDPILGAERSQVQVLSTRLVHPTL